MTEPSTAWAVARPHPALRHLVARYIGYAQRDVTLGVHRGLPSRHVTLIISLERPVRITGETPMQALVGGMHLGPVLIAQDPVQCGLHVELNPLGVRTLLGVSAAELSGQVVELGDLGLASLAGRLAEVPDWAGRFALLDEVFGAVAADGPGSAPEVGWAWRRMLGVDGRVRVESLAEEIGWSRRHFGELFRRELGLSPKQVARVLRFERALRLVRGRVDLARVAADCGYYDQAHLSNEWRALAGCSPRTWIAEELPFLQDSRVFSAADSGA
ncbi:helix-turn-helix domain-containing protein [Amycolatopsis anabasis]|uniref:helix-turn-helix domain-containing protein n=1 Tax=Amycolatopsis anabasis TaxID=1840409 RepID=UPI00131D5E5D|nr:helix-turn-helix transcriptional regulator [Amycolatopsis anabasis]